MELATYKQHNPNTQADKEVTEVNTELNVPQGLYCMSFELANISFRRNTVCMRVGGACDSVFRCESMSIILG